MKKLAIVFALVIFVPFCLYAQGTELAVDKCEIIPTVLKSADIAEFSCRGRYLELSDVGAGVVIVKELLTPQKMTAKFGKPFEVLDLRTEERLEGREWNWKFTWEFRVISDHKKKYYIPSFDIPWRLEEIGKPSTLNKTPTDSVPVLYVSTVVDDENLDIRDKIEFGNYRIVVLGLRIVLVILAFSGFACFFLAFRMRRKKKNKERPEEEKILSLKRVRSEFDAQIKELRDDADIITLLRNLLVAETPGLTNAYTPTGIVEFIRENESGYRKDALTELANYFLRYDMCIGTGDRFFVPPEKLKRAAHALRWPRTWFGSFRDKIAKISEWLQELRRSVRRLGGEKNG